MSIVDTLKRLLAPYSPIPVPNKLPNNVAPISTGKYPAVMRDVLPTKQPKSIHHIRKLSLARKLAVKHVRTRRRKLVSSPLSPIRSEKEISNV